MTSTIQIFKLDIFPWRFECWTLKFWSLKIQGYSIAKRIFWLIDRFLPWPITFKFATYPTDSDTNVVHSSYHSIGLTHDVSPSREHPVPSLASSNPDALNTFMNPFNFFWLSPSFYPTCIAGSSPSHCSLGRRDYTSQSYPSHYCDKKQPPKSDFKVTESSQLKLIAELLAISEIYFTWIFPFLSIGKSSKEKGRILYWWYRTIRYSIPFVNENFSSIAR